MDLDDMQQQARVRAREMAIKINDESTAFKRRKTMLVADYNTNIKKLENYKIDDDIFDAASSALEILHSKAMQLLTDIQTSTRGIEATVENVHASITRWNRVLNQLQTTKDYNSLDAASKQVLQDFSRSYKSAYRVVCLKVVVVAALLFVWRRHWKFVLMSMLVVITNLYLKPIAAAIFLMYYRKDTVAVTAILVYLAVVYGKLIVNLFKRGKFQKKFNLNADKCAVENARGNYTAACPKSDSSVSPVVEYTPCGSSTYKCCPNGMPADNATLSSCAPLACWQTQYGCCPDGTAKTSASDTCGEPVDCESSSFGCCANGTPRTDAAGTNCTINSLCGYSAYGCCPDGSNRTDKTGSNCAGYTTEPEEPEGNGRLRSTVDMSESPF